MNTLASLSDIVPSSVTYDPMAGILFMGLLFVGCLAFFVEVFVRSTEPRPSMPGRRIWHRAIAALLCAPGALHAVLFCLFAFRARALYGGWPPVFQFYKEMQPWTGVFEWWQGVMTLVGFASGVFALPAAIPVFCGWRRSAFLAAFRVLAILSAASLLGLYLPEALLPEGAVLWWYD